MMTWRLTASALLILGVIATPRGARGRAITARAADTVHVAVPTGERETDRASIMAALEQVRPGGTVQFAPGTYLFGGEIIRVTTPRITLLGHPRGTTLVGCHRGEFPLDNPGAFGNRCNGLELAAGWVTVRRLTFEHAFWALHVGCCWDDLPNMRGGDGGHLIEGNTFRNSSNALRVHGFWSEPTVIRNNRFVNNWHSVAIYGNTVHLLDNDITAPEPEQVQWFGFPADAIHIARPQSLHESVQGVTRTCENNVVAGNRIDGSTEGIMMTADEPGITCRNNVIRNNTIMIRRAHPPAMPGFLRVHDETDTTVIGVPLAMRGHIQDNLIEGNVIVGAEGLGIEIRGASRNRIMNNSVTRVVRREPFPGNALVNLPVLGGDPEDWREANGSAIWVSPGSNENEIADNSFVDVAACAVYLRGNRNVVELRDSSSVLCDLGTDNRVRGRDATAVIASVASVHATGAAGARALPAARADTVHVASPTGDQTQDRASILAALAQAQAGDVIQFAPGIYTLGEVIPIETPRLTILGHPDATTLRGCNPAEHREAAEAAIAGFRSGDGALASAAWRRCGMMELTGGHVTVRNLTFEYSLAGLLLGCCDGDDVFRPTEGGYRIDGNTFRNTHNSIRAMLHSSEPTVIRDNRFVNVFHAVSAAVSNFHVVNNEISAPQPDRVPRVRHPGSAISISPRRPSDTQPTAPRVCEGNVIGENNIEGYPDGIVLHVPPGAICRNNVIRGNTIAVRRVPIPSSWLYADLIPLTHSDDSTFVGTPLALGGTAARLDPAAEPGRVEQNRIEDNLVRSADGVGIDLRNASRNHIVNNTIQGIRAREPFPGNSLTGPPPWRDANGAGIWVSRGSNENEILDNIFEDIASHAIVLEGDRNNVKVRRASDAVHDLGTGNRVGRPDAR